MTPPLIAIENRICVLELEARALLMMDLPDEAAQINAVLESLELLRADHYALHGAVVTTAPRIGIYRGPQ